MEIITKQEALDQHLKSYYTGKPCANGHLSKRSTIYGTCRACQVLYNKNGITKRRAELAEIKD
jgi:hypothetical protein